MSSVIKIKRSEITSAIPTSNDIEVGEIAMNIPDGLIFTRNSSDAIIPVANYVNVTDLEQRLASLEAVLLISEFPYGDYGDFSSQLHDAFDIPLGVVYDCLTTPAGTVFSIDLGTL